MEKKAKTKQKTSHSHISPGQYVPSATSGPLLQAWELEGPAQYLNCSQCCTLLVVDLRCCSLICWSLSSRVTVPSTLMIVWITVPVFTPYLSLHPSCPLCPPQCLTFHHHLFASLYLEVSQEEKCFICQRLRLFCYAMCLRGLFAQPTPQVFLTFWRDLAVADFLVASSRFPFAYRTSRHFQLSLIPVMFSYGGLNPSILTALFPTIQPQL